MGPHSLDDILQHARAFTAVVSDLYGGSLQACVSRIWNDPPPSKTPNRLTSRMTRRWALCSGVLIHGKLSLDALCSHRHEC
jgi:hypothetical protein